MSRMSRGDQIVVKPKSDVYTALAVTACVVLIIGIVELMMQANVVFGDGLFAPSGTPPTSTR
jgi:hypothetical protein